MKTKKVKLSVPSSMDEISLRRYQRFIAECDNVEISEEYVGVKILEIFMDIKQTDTMQLSVSSMFEISNTIADVLAQKPSLVQRFKMGDTEFGFIPKLDDMTFGEYVDLDTYISDWSTMHKAMGVLFRPIKERKGHKYTIYDYDGDLWYDAMLDMPLSVAMGALLFFYRLEKDLQMNMIRSLNLTEVDNQMLSEENGGGIKASINSQKGT